MSPRWSRRRARRRSVAFVVLTAGVGLVLIAVLVGGLTQVSSQSSGYDAASNRSLAALGATVAEQSNATAAQLQPVMEKLPDEIRQTIQVELDAAADQSAAQAAAAAQAAGTAPAGSIAADLAQVFAERATAVGHLRSALYGFLGMQSGIPAGSPDAADLTSAAQPVPLSQSQAAARIAAAGVMLQQADALYRSVRARLAAATGHGRLPRSTWVRHPATWQPAAVTATVDLMATSADLASSHCVVIRTVRLTPPVLPPAPGAPAGTAVLSPTSQLGVTVVVANQGTIDEPAAKLRYALTDPATGRTDSQVRTVRLVSGASRTLPAVTFGLKAGSTRSLAVSVIEPAQQVGCADNPYQQQLQVAPAT